MLMLANTVAASGEKLGIGEAAITAVLGYAVVFLGLAMLMVVVMLMSKIMGTSAKKAAAPVAAPVAAAPAAPTAAPAPGSAGPVKLYNVADRDAAMLMAIVANKMGKPLNELRFISIKEVK